MDRLWYGSVEVDVNTREAFCSEMEGSSRSSKDEAVVLNSLAHTLTPAQRRGSCEGLDHLRATPRLGAKVRASFMRVQLTLLISIETQRELHPKVAQKETFGTGKLFRGLCHHRQAFTASTLQHIHVFAEFVCCCS